MSKELKNINKELKIAHEKAYSEVEANMITGQTLTVNAGEYLHWWKQTLL